MQVLITTHRDDGMAVALLTIQRLPSFNKIVLQICRVSIQFLLLLSSMSMMMVMMMMMQWKLPSSL